jgi:hypothetical protein
MVGCHACASQGILPAGKQLAPLRDLSQSGHGHYRGLYPQTHYTGLFTARQRPNSMPVHRVRRVKRGGLSGLGDSTAGVPAGTVLSYTATWGTTFSSWNDPNFLQSQIQGVLASKWGIVIDNQMHTTSDLFNLSGGSGFTLAVHTTTDYGASGDVKSIIDGELYNLGAGGLKSSIQLRQNVPLPTSTGDPTLPTAPSFDLPTFLSENWPVLAAAGIGFVVLKEVL